MSRSSLTLRRVVSLLMLALVIHLFVVPQIGGARKALDVVGSLNVALLGLAVALEAAALAAYALLMRLLLPSEHRPSFWICFGTVLASTGVNHVVPGGAATTTAVDYRLLGRAGVAADELGFALGLQAVGSAAVLNLLLWVALLLVIPTTGFHPIYATAAAVGAVLVTIFAVAVFALLRRSAGLARVVARLAGKLPRVESDRVERSMLRGAAQLRVLVEDPRLLRTVVGLAALNWMLDAAALWVMLAAFGHRTAADGLMVAYGLANVVAVIPVSPGGLGVIEAVLIPTLVGFGVPRAEASIGVVAYRLVNFWLPIPVGAASYVAVSSSTASEQRRRTFRDEIETMLQE